MRNNDKKIKTKMMEWRDENDGMEGDRRMVKMRKFGKQKIG